MRPCFLFTAALAAILCLPSPARADDGPIVVTATRSPTEAERLPARVEVVDRATIETRGLVTLTDAIGGEAVQGGAAGQQSSVFLRGTNSKHALALFDGIRLNDASNPTASYDFGQDLLGDVERVEVLRGPASSIYGSDAIGGVVNQIPRRGADSAFAPFAEIATGSFGMVHALVGADGSTNAIEYGVSAESLESDGYDLVPERMVTHTGDRDGARVQALTGSVGVQAGAWRLDTLARWRGSRAAFDTFSGGPFFDLRADDPNLENEATQRLWRLGAERPIGSAWNVRVSAGQVLSERAELDGGAQNSSAESTRDFVDASAQWRRAGASLIAGLSYERNAIDTAPQFADPLSARETQQAAYLVGQVDVGAHVTATGSVRIDDYQAFGTHRTYALGAVANFASLRVFAAYATSFKAPSLSERFEQSPFNIGNPDLDPEDARSWEVGADWRVAESLRVGGSYYQTRIEDLIEYQFALLQNVNIGEAEIDGAELYADFAPASWASLRVSYAWTDARDGSTDQRLARRPENAWRLDARVTPTARLTLALSWTYVGERTDVTYNDDGTFASSVGRASAFDLGALSATYDLSAHSQIFARVDNVLDQTYEQPNAFAGAPRGGSVGFRARF